MLKKGRLLEECVDPFPNIDAYLLHRTLLQSSRRCASKMVKASREAALAAVRKRLRAFFGCAYFEANPYWLFSQERGTGAPETHINQELPIHPRRDRGRRQPNGDCRREWNGQVVGLTSGGALLWAIHYCGARRLLRARCKRANRNCAHLHEL